MMKSWTGNNKHPGRISQSSLIRNGIVVIICITGMAVCLNVFLKDLNQSLHNSDEQPVGTVYQVSRNVKRLSANRLQWDRLERFSPVFEGDTINSDSSSEIKIHFINGETLELFENSSARILYRASGTSRFILRKGELQAGSGKKNLIVSLLEAAQVEMGNSDLRLELRPETCAGINASGSFTLKIYQGSGAFSSREGSRVLSAGETLRLSSDGLTMAYPAITMLSPRDRARILSTSRKAEPVEFIWRQLDSPELNAKLEISNNENFSGLKAILTLGNSASLVTALPDGNYFWRITSPYSEEAIDSGRFRIIFTDGPQAISPADGSTVNLQPGRSGIRFSWTVPEEAESVMLEIADNPGMTNPRFHHLVKRTQSGRFSYTSSELEAGHWYWRILPVYPSGLIAAEIASVNNPSSVNSFHAVKMTDLPPQRERKSSPRETQDSIPQLIYPPDNYTLEANRAPDLLFSWSKINSYNARFQLSERSDFTGAMLRNAEIFGSNLQGIFIKPGTYYWRITGRDPKKSSPPNRLVINPSLPSPRLDSPAEGEQLTIKEGEPVKFSWEPAAYANYYKFCLYLEGREAPLGEISSLQNNSVHVNFDTNTAGRFRWTVQGFSSPTNISSGRTGLIATGSFNIASGTSSSQGGQISWTIPRIANIQTYAGNVNSSVVLLSPPRGANIPAIQALRSPPEAKWSSEEPLRNAQLIISRTSNPVGDPKAIVKDAAGDSVTFPPLEDGIWYWLIRGDTSELRGATPGDPFWINILTAPLLPAPVPLEPLNKVIGIEQLTRDRCIKFRWAEVEEANAYIFSLFLDGEQQKLLITTPPQTACTYILENLSILNQGDYLWQVEAVYVDRNNVIEQRGKTELDPFTIEIQRSGNLQTHSQGVLYGQ